MGSWKLVRQGIRKCYVCKNIFPLSTEFFHKNKSRSTGLMAACKKCISTIRYTPHKKFLHYIYNAKKRKKSFKLSEEEFNSIVTSNCFYCGKPPKEGEYGNGIDRINNDLGYEISNCVPCCSPCNYLKGAFEQKLIKQRLKEIDINIVIKIFNMLKVNL